MPRPLGLALLCGVVVATLAPSTALGAWPPNPLVQNLPVIQATGDQSSPIAVADGAGGMIVSWLDARAVNYDVYAQRMNSNGDLLWPSTGLPVVTSVGDQTEFAMVSDSLGGAIFVWTDRRSGNYEIYAQRLAPNGTRLWSPGTDGQVVATGGTRVRATPALMATAGGGAIITWSDGRSGTDNDIYVQKLGPTGAPQWPVNGVALCAANGNDFEPRIVPDASGGAIVAWKRISPSFQTYAMVRRVNSGGTALWTANGVQAAIGITLAGAIQGSVGDTYVVWQSGVLPDLYTQHVDSLGTLLWGPTGLALVTATGSQQQVQLASDGAGGFVSIWKDDRGGFYGQRTGPLGNYYSSANSVIYALTSTVTSGLRLVGDGTGGGWFTWSETRDVGQPSTVYAQRFWFGGGPLWVPEALPVRGIAADKQAPALVPDGTGGIFVAFADRLDYPNFEISAQRFGPAGFLGHPEPKIVGVRDVPGDQGGKVAISWTPSYFDVDSFNQIESYRIRRRTAPGAYTEIGFAPAWALPGYGWVATTPSDSMSAASPANVFVVQARYYFDLGKTFDSPPDSGWSLDNLAPSPPIAFQGEFSAGITQLSWGANSETDLDGYRLYRGTTEDFAADDAHLVATVEGTSFTDPNGAGCAYKLVAIDAHGNASAAATLVPAGTNLAGPVPAALAFAGASPNPARSGATFDFALPRAGHVRLGVFDVAGRLVRTFDFGALTAGAHATRFDLTDDHGRSLASGLYLARLEFEGRAIVRRLAVVR